ncbi:hypothetical protein E4U19_005278 [Claviceps sp. Clav32 group G5]|nr:hypothetical protein E4U40_006495 [Claviceps sp. LM458 group G5]KAG6022065.1 hypothetical protein E4U19_005278 [Claviceps sp. Clav32 group G5]KAG6043535.1 hypothetical protein E4U39_004404 [Claviceps sp. Clav50 group G5]
MTDHAVNATNGGYDGHSAPRSGVTDAMEAQPSTARWTLVTLTLRRVREILERRRQQQEMEQADVSNGQESQDRSLMQEATGGVSAILLLNDWDEWNRLCAEFTNEDLHRALLQECEEHVLSVKTEEEGRVGESNI